MAWRGEHQLLAVSAQAGGDGDGADVMEDPRGVSDGRMRRRAVQNVETAAAHLEDFVTLTGFALASLGRPCAHWPASPSTYTSEQREVLFRASKIIGL